MVLHFRKSFLESLKGISYQKKHHEFMIHQEAEERTEHNFPGIIQRYGETKWKVVDILNEYYNSLLPQKFDLYNWLHGQESDELAYFLNEAGSNCLNHSQFKSPHKFHVWLGERGFIVGIEQLGKGFPAELVHKKRIKQNEGAAFGFFEKCRSSIFFDDPKDAKMVFMEYRFVR